MPGKIGTHSGKFHCDEALACFMLKQLPEFKDHEIVRSRDPAVHATCDIVVDVGDVFDHEKRRYDHHQAGFTHTMDSLGSLKFNTKLSSAGLIYAHYGKAVINQLLGGNAGQDQVDMIFHRIYENFIEGVDAVDNGIPQYDGLPRYRMPGNLSSRVDHFNPNWNENDVNPDDRFVLAMNFVGGEFADAVKYLANVWWPARSLVEKAVDSRFSVDDSGKIIQLEGGGPKEIYAEKISLISFLKIPPVINIESKRSRRAKRLNSKIGSPYRLLGGPSVTKNLSEVSGIPGGVFLSMPVDLLVAIKTREGAVRMAREALKIGGIESQNGNEAKEAKIDDSTVKVTDAEMNA
ncbi:unnamed protein product [Caenorhabditis auriculariae]|uniref:Uncharacterized protein n=1 Tax=Caenorhabditis auriculariae TaxID=2777116 RepID=A0A8S1H8L3_9PELO|nr:unnamed protein product [Caenorhabditis auriculariae]